MGCGGSKTVKIKDSEPSPFIDRESSNHTQEDEINVFDNTENNNELGGSSYNAKPRLRSAIRRGNDCEIRPVISDVNDTVDTQPDIVIIKPPPLDFTDHSIVSDIHFNRDSGFDSNRANSEASDLVKSGREETTPKTGRHSHSSYITMRPDSVTTDSVITARDLNASFVTVSDDFTTANGDITWDLETPLDDLTDFEDLNSRTLSNTPSRSAMSNTPSRSGMSNTPSRSAISVEPRPISVYPKNIDVIKEESEGGFTPRSLFSPDDVISRLAPQCPSEEITQYPSGNIQKYYRDEVIRHNQKMGWCELGIYKGMVYDTREVINVFSPLYNERVQSDNELLQAKKEFLDSDSFDGDEDFEDEAVMAKPFEVVYPRKIVNPTSSLGRAMKMLRNHGIDETNIDQKLSECVIGVVEFAFSQHHWDAFRKDIDKVLDDLIRADLKDELTQNTRDILEQLQRWIRKHRDQNPQPLQQQNGDPNIAEFVLPDGIQNNPECLRQWIENWTKLDLDIPECGAWRMYELEDVDIGDPDEIFIATLRSHVDLSNPPIVDVDGEAAWTVLQPGIFADDIMTEEQKRTEENRRYRTDLHDPRRMKRRRDRLLQYFVKKYEMHENNVSHFLNWAQAMEDGERRFQLLCEMK